MQIVTPRPVSVFESSPSWSAAEPDEHPGCVDATPTGSVVGAKSTTESTSKQNDMPVRMSAPGETRSSRTSREPGKLADGDSLPLRHAAVLVRPVVAPLDTSSELSPNQGRAASKQDRSPGTDPRAMAGSTEALHDSHSPIRPAPGSGRPSDAEPVPAEGEAREPKSVRMVGHQPTPAYLHPTGHESVRPESVPAWQRHEPLYPLMNSEWPSAMPMPGNTREEKTVHVSIGRIEVKLLSPASAQPKVKSAKGGEPTMTLDRYLHRHDGGGR